MCVCDTNTWLVRSSLRGGTAAMSPRSNSRARRSNRMSTNSAGSPNGPLTSRGWKIGRMPRSSARCRARGSPQCPQVSSDVAHVVRVVHLAAHELEQVVGALEGGEPVAVGHLRDRDGDVRRYLA